MPKSINEMYAIGSFFLFFFLTPQTETRIHYLQEYFTLKILKKEPLFHFPLLRIGRHAKKDIRDRSAIQRDLNTGEKWSTRNINYKGNCKALYLERNNSTTWSQLSKRHLFCEGSENWTWAWAHGGKKVSCAVGCFRKMVDTAGKNLFKIQCYIFKNYQPCRYPIAGTKQFLSFKKNPMTGQHCRWQKNY